MSDLVAVEVIEFVGIEVGADFDAAVTSTAQVGAGGAGGGGAVDSVNTQTGVVVLDPDDLDDSATTNKFVTASDVTNLGNLSGTNTGDDPGYEPGGTDVAVADGGTGASTAAGARTALNAERAYLVNVMDHGATGDGATDDITAINAAITACPEGGTVLFPVPAASYKISTPILPTANITLTMEHAPRWSYDGGSPCVIKGLASFSGTALIYIDAVDGVRIRHLSLDGGLILSGSTAGIYCNGAVRDLQVEDVDITTMTASAATGHGFVTTTGTKGLRLSRVSVYNCNTGFSLANLTDSELDDCLAVSCDGDGFNASNCYETTFISPRAVFNRANGIHLSGAGTTTSSTSLGQCTLIAPATDRNAECGILIDQEGEGPIQLVAPRCRRDGSVIAGTTASCGIKVLGTDGANLAVPVDIIAPQITPGEDDGGGGDESPLYGIRCTNAQRVSIIGGEIWAVTAAFGTTANDNTSATPESTWWNGGRASKTTESPSVLQAYGGSGSMTDLVDDTTPQLGGDLDLNGNVITGLEIGTDVQRQMWINVLDYGATGDGTTDDSAAIQAAIDAANHNATFTGLVGEVFLPIGKYYVATGLVSEDAGLIIRGEGIAGVESALASASTQIIVGDGEWGLTLGTAGSQFRGYSVENIGFQELNDGQALGGLHLLSASDGRFEGCSFGRFTAGHGVFVEGASSEAQASYNTWIDCRWGRCLTAYEQQSANGTRFIGGYLEGSQNGTLSVLANSVGVKLTSGDTFRSMGTIIQGYDTLIEAGGNLDHEFYGVRLEIWGTQAIHVLTGARRHKYFGYGTNNLGGSGGAGIVIDAGAEDTMVGAVFENCNQGRVIDNGTRTRYVGFQGVPSQGAVPGTVVGKQPVFNPADGSLLGYQPVYDDVTGISLVRYLGGKNPDLTGQTTIARTLTAAVPVGDTIIIGGGYGGGTTRAVSAADDAGSTDNVYTVDRHDDETTGDTPHSFVISCPVTTALAAGDTITVTFDGTVNYPMIQCYEYRGMLVGTFTDDDQGDTAASGSTAVAASADVTASVGYELVFASVYAGNTGGQGITAGTGFTELHEIEATSKRLETMTRTTGLAGDYSATATLAIGAGWAISAVGYKPVASTATPAGGDITTDAAWAAAGDLIVATGNDTAAVLSAGSEANVLKITSGVPAWGAAPESTVNKIIARRLFK